MSTPQSEVDGSLVDSVLSRNQVLPLRRETQRLVKANNALHLHLIAQNEAMDAAQREADSKLRALAAAQSDLKFLFMQKRYDTLSCFSLALSLSLSLSPEQTHTLTHTLVCMLM